MTELPRAVEPEDTDPYFDRILRIGAAVLCVAGLSLAALLAAGLPQTLPRVLINGLIGVAGGLTVYLSSSGRKSLARRVAIGGYWLGVTFIVTINGGLTGPNLVNYPLIMAIAGWMLGARQAVLLAVLTELVFIALFVADARGMIKPAVGGGPLVQLVLVSVVTLVTAGITLLARRGYLSRLGEAQKAAAEIAAHQDELRRAHDQLEVLVEQRTRELEVAKSAAEAASVAKSAFLANMSHEIRTPLNAITGMSLLIRRAGVEPAQAQRLDKLEAASRHLLSIVDAVLDLSKVEAGKLTLDEGPVDLQVVVSGVVSMVSDRAAAKGLRLHIDVPAEPVQLMGDATRLQQALLNLATNAVKFTAQGQVTVMARVQEQNDDQVVLRFEVADTGVGIAPEALPRLFAAFEQADNSTSRQYGGTGLGLAITRRLAQLMGGDAGAQSELGKGSSFWFTARLKRAPASQAHPTALVTDDAATTIRRHHAGRRVLLAEDDLINREVASALLKDLGLIVDTAVNGREAVALARQGGYALILMDMQMPEMDGIEATRQIREQAGNRERPILALTANAFAEDKARCLAAGMNDFIGKPVMPERLHASLLRWLQQTE